MLTRTLGIVGSDPYLAPEVYESKEYDAAAVDIWSLAIIYCCMTLRRFPWKLPRLSDNSFKLFAADPTPGHEPERLVGPVRSHGDHSDSESRHSHSHSRSHSRNHSTGKAEEGSPATGQGEKKEVIRGPWRILRLLPRESRKIMWRMLDMNPKTRATMDEILAENWIAEAVICQQVENGEVFLAEDHTHILEPPSSSSAPPSKT